ncbi:dihydrodipicolinate reductase C-terminal domain-containing protein [Streptomyces sp. NPDC026589]|uniref:dihydrodipicolinate reductase C-terminal domain-containing protein n=1 Tax=Streptomyces sp. NPDC026589 TaxID=3155609 RepID=UPI0033C987BF
MRTRSHDHGARLGIVGTGRLGGAVRRLATDQGHPVHVYDTRAPGKWRAASVPDVIVDCSAAAVVNQVADLCGEFGLPLVECVSGLTDGQLDHLSALGRAAPVVLAANLSLGNYLQTRALRYIADVLVAMERAGVRDVMPEAAVLERHPATKAHRPSTTAVALAREWSRRTSGMVVDVASLRAGPAVSDHEIRLGWAEQSLTVTHEVRSLGAAASGAIRIAGWVAGRPPGTYTVHEAYDDLLATTGGTAEPGPQGGDGRG